MLDVVRAAIRTWLRYLVPLTVLSAIALSPLIAIAGQLHVPHDAAGAQGALTVGCAMLAVAWVGQLMLAGAAAALTRARPSQLGALGRGFLQLLHAIIPCLVAAAAIAIGSLALAVPGVVLLVLLALTGASPARALPDPLRDSIAVARAHLPAVALAVATMLALDAAIGVVAYVRFMVPQAKPPMPAQLAAARTFVRAIVLGLVVVSPIPATILAAIRARADR